LHLQDDTRVFDHGCGGAHERCRGLRGKTVST
jgi:hypothetical protein